MRKLLMLVMAVVLLPILAAGQPLADRVPANAIVMASWQGTEHLPAAYERSHLRGLLDASALREVFNDFISFANLPETAGDNYPLFLLLTQTAGGMGDLFGVKSPPMILPTLAKLKEHLAPAGSVSWTDDAGWHSKSVEPFPCATLMASQSNLLLGGGAMGTSILLPALAGARQAADQIELPPVAPTAPAEPRATEQTEK